MYIVKNDKIVKYVQNYTVENNIIKIQWNTYENTELGFYTITAEYDRASKDSDTGVLHYAIDYTNAFEIVPTSCDEEDVDTILAGNASEPAKDGLSSFELWKKQNNLPDATYDDYVEYLQKPATDFINSIQFVYDSGYLTIETL